VRELDVKKKKTKTKARGRRSTKVKKKKRSAPVKRVKASVKKLKPAPKPQRPKAKKPKHPRAKRPRTPKDSFQTEIDRAFRADRANKLEKRRLKHKRGAEQGALVKRVNAGKPGALKELLLRFPKRGEELRRELKEARTLAKLPPRKRAFVKRSRASKKGWARRRLSKEREKTAPNPGASPRRRVPEELRVSRYVILTLMVDSGHPDFLSFRKRGLKLGLTKREIMNEWFSPKLRKGLR
jgi:hypothetical protein